MRICTGSARPLEQGLTQDETAAIVAEELAQAINSGTCVDDHMQDQVLQEKKGMTNMRERCSRRKVLHLGLRSHGLPMLWA